MSCSTNSSCCQKPIVSVCLPEQTFPVAATTGSTLFGPNPAPIAASGVISNESTNAAVLDVTFYRGTAVIATLSGIASGQSRAFAVTGFTTISATPTVSAAVANLCMTEFFRPSV
ncbi:S-Ena type endospore appendage [Paenibacillus sp. 1P07SE]|uniref:S-Ena type endospore appendage n=1 Tax=Paenibacillus sp. 1P07SE TaxID=3132209 RepID=UPI0039A403E2